MPSVFGVHDTQFGGNGYSGCAWYRIHLPFGQLKAHGWDAAYGPALAPESDPDIIVMQRLDNPQAVAYWRELGEHYLTVYEADDDPFSLDPVNWLARPAYDNAEMRQAVRDCASAARLVTVTTEPLAQVFRQLNDNVAVLPNRIPAWLCDLQRPVHEKLTIGWMGGVSHSRDMTLIAQAWRDVVDETGCRGHFVGADYRTMLRPHGFDFAGWIMPPEATYAQIDFDIGLAPLADTVFNASKSAIKVMEYAALGIPVIASDHPVYRDYVTDGVTGFLCRTPSQWRKKMRLLAYDERLREWMGAQARKRARTWTIEEHWPDWAAAYERALSWKTPSPSLSPAAAGG